MYGHGAEGFVSQTELKNCKAQMKWSSFTLGSGGGSSRPALPGFINSSVISPWLPYTVARAIWANIALNGTPRAGDRLSH